MIFFIIIMIFAPIIIGIVIAPYMFGHQDCGADGQKSSETKMPLMCDNCQTMRTAVKTDSLLWPWTCTFCETSYKTCDANQSAESSSETRNK